MKTYKTLTTVRDWFASSFHYVLQTYRYKLRGTDTQSRETALLKLFLLPFEKKRPQKGKDLCSTSKFFPFRIDPFSDGNWCTGKPTKKLQNAFHVKMTENQSSLKEKKNTNNDMHDI